MALTSIGFQKTPARPVEITFAANLGIPSGNQTMAVIGHLGPSAGAASASVLPYTVITVNNIADPVAASSELSTKFGVNSELALMCLRAVQVNQGSSSLPAILGVGLNPADTDFGSGTAVKALLALNKTEAEFIVSPYDGQSASGLTLQLQAQALAMSGSARVQQSQFGTFGVVFNRSVVDPSTLVIYDTQYLIANWLRDTGASANAPALSVGEMASACAAVIAANPIPFNPLDAVVLPTISAPAQQSDWISVGAGLESETALSKGWTPLRVLPNTSVAFVRTVTTRITVGDGVTQVTAYFDVQDFQVLYFFRKTIFTRFSQPDFMQRKASGGQGGTGQQILSEAIRLAQLFQDQNMFQAVGLLAPQFVVQRNATDRGRFDLFIPVNVIPGLHVIATNVQSGTQFDQILV